MTNPRAVVINSSHPELDQLAGELALRGLLHQYFGRYFPDNRAWERAMKRFPFTRKLFAAGPGRRNLPSGLQLVQRFQPGAMLDLAAGVIPRDRLGRTGEHLYRAMLEGRDRAIIQDALRHYNQTDAVIANFTVGAEIFERARAANQLTVLNSPLAHPATIQEITSQEAQLHPEFAADLVDQTASSEVFARLQQEVALADRILVGSSFARQTFIAQGVPPEKIFSSTYGVNVAQFASDHGRVDDGVFRAIFVGQITQRKGIKYLFEAWRSIAGPAMELVLAGRFMAAAAPCQPYAPLYRYAGFLNASQLRELLRQADVLVLPSLAEGMPLVVLQAMAAQVPVIVTPNGPGDVVRDGIDGFVVPIRDSNAIAEKLLYLRDNPAHRQEMGRRAHERALTFTWERFRTEAADEVERLMRTR